MQSSYFLPLLLPVAGCNTDANHTVLTLGARVEGVVVDFIVGAAHAEADAVLAVLDPVVVDIGTEWLHEGDTSVSVIVNVVVYRNKEPTEQQNNRKNNIVRRSGGGDSLRHATSITRVVQGIKETSLYLLRKC